MKKSDVIGRRIVGVRQERFWNEHTGSWSVSLEALVLDNGSIISLSAFESETEPYTSARVVKPTKAKV